jgi:hypothetical protein
MDEQSYNILKKLKLKQAKLFKTSDIETAEIAQLKKDRNKGEYSWTLKSVFIDYLFNKYKHLNNIFYLDGDIYFFNDVAQVYKDIGNASIAIAPHRFPNSMIDRVRQTGIFNAGVIYMKRDKEAFGALKRWKRQCIKWCYWRLEDGKLGDQMYLDEWPKLYKSLHQFTHKGINLAPWNVNEYKLTKKDGKIFVDNQPLIFYHFHQFKIYKDLTFQESTGYKVSENAVDLIYSKYEQDVLEVIQKVKKVDPSFSDGLDEIQTSAGLKDSVIKNLLPIYWKIKSLLQLN